ncbi:MAG TPA: hypothetical protein VFI47_01435, partial [Acidimicrobiales bacterium]|nr:hypothetical protein [Acidimicrobiales bacterium]
MASKDHAHAEAGHRRRDRTGPRRARQALHTRARSVGASPDEPPGSMTGPRPATDDSGPGRATTGARPGSGPEAPHAGTIETGTPEIDTGTATGRETNGTGTGPADAPGPTDTDAPSGPGPAPDAPPFTPPRWLTWAAVALAVLPLAVSAVVLVASAGDMRPVGDLAITEMRTRDVGRHELLLGPYSRDGWYHPGPAVFALLALPYRLSGSEPVGLLLGALAINAAAIGGMAALARRLGGTGAMLCTLVAAALLVRSLGIEIVNDPWNPYITVLPYGVLLLLTWSLLCGERWALPVAALVTTFLVQTHVGNTVLAVPLLALGAAGLVVADRRVRGRRRGLAPVAGLTLLLAGVAWLPPVIDQLTNDPGNLRAIGGWFRSAADRTHTLTEGWNVVSAQFWLAPEWVTGQRGLTLLNEP